MFVRQRAERDWGSELGAVGVPFALAAGAQAWQGSVWSGEGEGSAFPQQLCVVLPHQARWDLRVFVTLSKALASRTLTCAMTCAIDWKKCIYQCWVLPGHHALAAPRGATGTLRSGERALHFAARSSCADPAERSSKSRVKKKNPLLCHSFDPQVVFPRTGL